MTYKFSCEENVINITSAVNDTTDTLYSNKGWQIRFSLTIKFEKLFFFYGELIFIKYPVNAKRDRESLKKIQALIVILNISQNIVRVPIL